MLNFPFQTPKNCINFWPGMPCTYRRPASTCLQLAGGGAKRLKGEEKTALSEAEAFKVSASLEGADFSES